MNQISAWIGAFRLRTLPLAFSSIITGSFLAARHYDFEWEVTVLALTTTLFLQVLSNLSNDYGDSVHGADSQHRIGPARAVQSGKISKENMKTAMFICAALAFFSGMLLLFISLREQLITLLLFVALGISAIAAAIKYTAGKNPYGYKGFGDVFVFLFFGIVGVQGTFYLHTHTFLITGLLPAATIGLLSAAVLNLNNMRDHVSDALAGKNTVVVKMGYDWAKKYHAAMILLSFAFAFTFAFLIFWDTGNLLSFIFLPVFVFLIFFHLKKVKHTENPAELDPELKKVALSTFVFSLLFGLGISL